MRKIPLQSCAKILNWMNELAIHSDWMNLRTQLLCKIVKCECSQKWLHWTILLAQKLHKFPKKPNQVFHDHLITAYEIQATNSPT